MRLAFIALESACVACFAIGVAVTVVTAGVMWAAEMVMGRQLS